MATVTRGTGFRDLVDNYWPALSVSQVVGITGPSGPGVFYPESSVDGYTPINDGGKFYLQWAGLQKPLAGTLYNVTYEVAPTSLIRGTDFVKAAFTQGLRVAFANQTMFPAYVYNKNDTLSRLGIHESFPKRPFKVPGLVVGTGPATVARTTLSDKDLLTEQKDPEGTPVAFYAWGKLTLDVTIGIVATEDSDRRKLTDITAMFIRHLFTFQFAKFGIGFQTLQIRGEQEIEWQGQTLYMNNITVPCHTEFQIRYPIKLVDVISQLNIEPVGSSL